MKWIFGLGTVLALAVSVMPTVAQNGAPQVGDKAPDFKLVGTDGKTYTLSQFRGKSAVVIAWYPKASTSGCTMECNSLRDTMGELAKYRVQVFGASVDSVEDNKKFAESNKYNFPLLSDSDKSLAQALGVLNTERGFANRWTYVVDKEGVIRFIDKSVKVASHGKDVAAQLESLGIPKK